MIETKELCRHFRTPIKDEGMRGVMRLLIKPSYKTTEALKNVSFQIERGNFIGLIGANGAGKTTLLKILSGLIPPTSGNAKVMSFVPFERSIDFRKKISLVMGQKAQLWWDLSALDAFDLLRAIYEIPYPSYKKRLNELTELLNVNQLLKTQIRKLSLGERMKMELIGALIHWPEVIFLDEPTIGLDILAAHNLRSFLKKFNQNHKATIILTSHNMEDIEELCPRILILKTGELIYDGSPNTLTKKGEIRLKLLLLQYPTPEELAKTTELPITQIEVEQESPEPRHIIFHIKKELIIAVLQKLMRYYQVIDMSIEEQSLETVIQQIYEKNN
ncbi:MAG: ATP-binding cassette domain-containing protein [Bdellovibrio sp.]|nr:ATP-binding cassette domain-containing protein [Bdellovibrio sp.]